MIKLTDRILFTLDKDQVTGILFVDIRKAFEISEVLFNKLFSMSLDKNMSYDSHMDELIVKSYPKA